MGADRATGEHQLARDRAAHEFVQGRVDDVAPSELRMREHRGRRRDAQVAAHGEVEAAGDCRTVDGRDQGQREPQQRVVVSIGRCPQRAVEGGVGRRGVELLQVESGAEHGPVAGDDHDRHGFVRREGVERVADGVAQGDRQSVALGGPA